MVKSFMGIKNPKFSKITRIKDESGRVLHYKVKSPSGVITRHNTLKSARVMAIKV